MRYCLEDLKSDVNELSTAAAPGGGAGGGATALHAACATGALPAAELLVGAGAAPASRDAAGLLPADYLPAELDPPLAARFDKLLSHGGASAAGARTASTKQPVASAMKPSAAPGSSQVSGSQPAAKEAVTATGHKAKRADWTAATVAFGGLPSEEQARRVEAWAQLPAVELEAVPGLSPAARKVTC